MQLEILAIVVVFVLIALLGAWAWRLRKVRTSSEPEYELEKLINCRSCGSLVPEGVRRCAFCGAWQKPQASGE